jgi:hypothetical protein
LRALDVEISDDMLAVLDALRWAKMGIGDMVPNGDSRIDAVLKHWGMYGPEQTEQPINADPFDRTKRDVMTRADINDRRDVRDTFGGETDC